MALEIHALVYFLRALDRGSMQRAAEDLGVTTSTVSRAIANLEYGLAAPLAVRRPEGVVPSFEGRQLLDTARQILARCAGLSRALAGKPPGRSARLDRAALRALLAAPVSLRTLSHAVAVMEEGSISAAARRLNITQPTLSRRIGELEAFLGTSLFERRRAGIVPTAAARRLQALAAEIEALAGGVLKRADVSFVHQVRDIRLGAVMPAGVDSSLTILLAGIIEDFTRREANRFVSVSSGPAQALMNDVMAGRLDAAIVDVPQVPEPFEAVEIAQRPLYVVAPAALHRERDTAASLALRLPMALPMIGTGLRRAIDHLFETGFGRPRRTIECGSIPVLMRLVINGTCCAIIPEGSLPRSDPRVVPVVIPGSRLVTSLIWMPARRDSPRVRQIRDLVARRAFGA